MIKRILVLLGETPSSASARQYTFRLARETNAGVAGLAGIDLAYIEAPMPGALGTGSYKARLEHQLHEQADRARLHLHEIYEQECHANGIPFEWLSFEGDPIGTLQIAAETRDLVVTGHDTAFRGNIRERLSETLARTLHITPRPVVICGDEMHAGRDVLVAYDGSIPAMRVIQMFALLRFASNCRVYVTSIDGDRETAERRAGAATDFLRSHDYEVEEFPVCTDVHPADALAIEVVNRKIATLVMGAYGHRGFREFLFGSTTRRLAENPPCALFVYH